MSRHATTLAAVLLGAGLAVVPTAPSAAADHGATPFTIRSSLDGKTVLPHRIRWIAYPSTDALFPGVEFLIDGRVVFANRLTPYAFGADGRDEATRTVKTGYLVTSWLSPGKHRFTVRARGLGANRKTTATKTVVARVPSAPARPARHPGHHTQGRRDLHRRHLQRRAVPVHADPNRDRREQAGPVLRL